MIYFFHNYHDAVSFPKRMVTGDGYIPPPVTIIFFDYSTVTDFARFRGLSMSQPRSSET